MGIERRLRRWGKSGTDALDVTKTAFEAYAKRLAKANPDEKGLDHDNARAEAVNAFLRQSSADKEVIERLVAAVAEHPLARALLDKRLEVRA